VKSIIFFFFAKQSIDPKITDCFYSASKSFTNCTLKTIFTLSILKLLACNWQDESKQL